MDECVGYHSAVNIGQAVCSLDISSSSRKDHLSLLTDFTLQTPQTFRFHSSSNDLARELRHSPERPSPQQFSKTLFCQQEPPGPKPGTTRSTQTCHHFYKGTRRHGDCDVDEARGYLPPVLLSSHISHDRNSPFGILHRCRVHVCNKL